MKKFLIKTIIFAVLLLASTRSIQYLLPYYWGNPGYAAKIRYLNNNSEEYDTLFFGSSRIFRQVDPILFDSLTNFGSKSYNLGSGATYTPESYYLLKNFLRRSNSVDKGLILVELQVVTEIPDVNLHTARSKYYLDFQEYQFASRVISEKTNLSNKSKREQIKNYNITYLDRISSLGIFSDLMDSFRESATTRKNVKKFGLNNRGHRSLDTQFRENPSKGLRSRKKDFSKNPSEIENRKKALRKLYNTKSQITYSKTHLKRVNELITMAEKLGYNLIFILPPRLDEPNYVELLPLFQEIDSDHRIDMADPNRFPDFYTIDNSFDVGHMNDRGVKLFTTELAAQVNELLAK